VPFYGLDTEAVKAYDTVGEISGVFVEHKEPNILQLLKAEGKELS